MASRPVWRRPTALERVSYDDLDRQILWRPPARRRTLLAEFDCERTTQRVPEELLVRYGFVCAHGFLSAWTATEALCKALRVPILQALREGWLIAQPTGQDTVRVLRGRRFRVRTKYISAPFDLTASFAYALG